MMAKHAYSREAGDWICRSCGLCTDHCACQQVATVDDALRLANATIGQWRDSLAQGFAPNLQEYRELLKADFDALAEALRVLTDAACPF
jgi:hypothetical protein